MKIALSLRLAEGMLRLGATKLPVFNSFAISKLCSTRVSTSIRFSKAHEPASMGEVAVCFYPAPSTLPFVPPLDDEEGEFFRGDEEDSYVHYLPEPEHHENSHDLTNTGLLPLPKAFLEFLTKSGVDPSIYTAAQTLPRYVRLKPGFEDELPNIEAELGLKLSPVPWLQGFFSLPQEALIASSEAYRLGKIYGMDAASGAAVEALGVLPGDHVLDLCAAPGAKLCMVADHLRTLGTLTGVDIAPHRLAACRTMLLKYGLGKRCRLFVTDGTKFSLLPFRQSRKDQVESDHQIIGDIGNEANEVRVNDSYLANSDWMHSRSASVYGEWTSRRTRKEKRDAKRTRMKDMHMHHGVDREPELLFYGNDSGVVGLTKNDLFENACTDAKRASELGYDKVLVDVECTHDGSLKHICKYEQWGWDTLERRVLDHSRLASLTFLQLQLLTNGFKLLKVGGTLLYSTCSFTTAQNEEVIEKFLSGHPDAELLEIEAAKKHEWPCKSGFLVHTLRFDPVTSRTSGLFMAKIMKMHATP